MSHEFELHHRVSNLISLLKVQDVTGSEAYVELLLANRTPYITTTVSTHAAKRKIAELSSKGEAFLKKYEELKLKQPRDLDPLVYLLSKMAGDKQLCEFVRARRPEKPKAPVREASITEVFGKADGEELKAQLPPKGAVLTAEEITQLKGKLESLTANIQGQQKKQQTKKIAGTYPEMPAWLTERPYLSCDFLPPGTSSHSRGVPGGKGGAGGPAPPTDATLCPGDSLTPSGTTRDSLTWTRPWTSPSVSSPPGSSPAASHYSSIARFVEGNAGYVKGTVNQALGAAMRDLVKEYLIVVAQLEHQLRASLLTVQKLWYYVQPCLRTLEVTSRVASLVERGECRGGKTLSVLHGAASGYVGDERAQELCLHLAEAASRPYFEMLGGWVYRGVVSDTYGEFMICEEAEVGRGRLTEEYNDAYWETRYTVVQENIPSFLEHVAGKVRDTGKYLNVLHECGNRGDGGVGSGGEEEEEEGVGRGVGDEGAAVLGQGGAERDLLGHLRSIKHYYLVDQGDFFVHLMDMAEGELRKTASDISLVRLESLLELALHASLVDLDPYKENLRVSLAQCDLITQLREIIAIEPETIGPQALTPRSVRRTTRRPEELTGLEALSLEYVVQWPLSLVVNRKALFKYQMLFRHLFHCLHTERQLCKAWTVHRIGKACSLRSLPAYASSFALLQRMLHYVQNLQYFMAFEVLERNWCTLDHHLRSMTTTVDDVLAAHTDFLDRCLKDCMLSNKGAIERIHHLLILCTGFAQQMQQVASSLDATTAATAAAGKKGGKWARQRTESLLEALRATVTGKAFEEMVSTTEKDFTKNLTSLLGHLHQLSTQDVEHMTSGMASRLDFNGFYQTQVAHHQ
ncbi:hypothetical protein EMCRGX_G000725 [Ephydatia muelleri]